MENILPSADAGSRDEMIRKKPSRTEEKQIAPQCFSVHLCHSSFSRRKSIRGLIGRVLDVVLVPVVVAPFFTVLLNQWGLVDSVIPFFDERRQDSLDELEVQEHVIFRQLPVKLNDHPIGMAVEMSTLALVPRKPMHGFPPKSLRDFHK